LNHLYPVAHAANGGVRILQFIIGEVQGSLGTLQILLESLQLRLSVEVALYTCGNNQTSCVTMTHKATDVRRQTHWSHGIAKLSIAYHGMA